MKITSVIAEYNPFHNGHAYQIQKAKEMTGADYVIVVMSGDFTQRGTPAIINKYARANMALQNGADMVLELPVCYATGSAEYFAKGAIALLDKLGCVDSVCFGSECGDIDALTEIAKVLANETPQFKETIQRNLKMGDTYPVARNKALVEALPHMTTYDQLLASPNNILGIEYIKALIQFDSKIKPYTNIRIGSDYHDYKLAAANSSAISIRQSLLMQHDMSLIKDQVPASCFEILSKNFEHCFPIFEDDFSTMLKYKLLSEKDTGYQKYLDMTKSISDKIRRNVFKMTDYDQFCDLLKSKDLTYARISRILSHILLDITKEEVDTYKENGWIFYARVLGLNTQSFELTRTVKEHSSITLISKLKKAEKQLYPIGVHMLKKDLTAAHIYEIVAGQKYNAGMIDEYRRQIELI